MTRHPHVVRARRYAVAVRDRKIPACRWVRLACLRHLADLATQRRADFPYRFDPAKAERVCGRADRGLPPRPRDPPGPCPRGGCMSGDEWLERIAATSPAGPACPTCGGETRLVILRGMYCPACKVLRACPSAARGTLETPKPKRGKVTAR